MSSKSAAAAPPTDEHDVIQRHLIQLKGDLKRGLSPKHKATFEQTISNINMYNANVLTDWTTRTAREFQVSRQAGTSHLPDNFKDYVNKRADLARWYTDEKKKLTTPYEDMERARDNALQRATRGPKTPHEERNINFQENALKRLKAQLDRSKKELKEEYRARLNAIFESHPEHEEIDQFHENVDVPTCRLHGTYHCTVTSNKNGLWTQQCKFGAWANQWNELCDEERICDMAKRDSRINEGNAHLYRQNDNLFKKYDFPPWVHLMPLIVPNERTRFNDPYQRLQQRFMHDLKTTCPGNIHPRVLEYARHYVQRILYLRAYDLPTRQGITNAPNASELLRERHKKLMKQRKPIIYACVYIVCEELGIFGWGQGGDTGLFIRPRSPDAIIYPPTWGLLRLHYNSDEVPMAISTNMKEILQTLFIPHLIAFCGEKTRAQEFHIRSGLLPVNLEHAHPADCLGALWSAYVGYGLPPIDAPAAVHYADGDWRAFNRWGGGNPIKTYMQQGWDRDRIIRAYKEAVTERLRLTTLAQTEIKCFFRDVRQSITSYQNGSLNARYELKQQFKQFTFSDKARVQLAYYWRNYKTDEQRKVAEEEEQARHREADEWVRTQINGGVSIDVLKDQTEPYRRMAVVRYISQKGRNKRSLKDFWEVADDGASAAAGGGNRSETETPSERRVRKKREEQDRRRKIHESVMADLYPEGPPDGY